MVEESSGPRRQLDGTRALKSEFQFSDVSWSVGFRLKVPWQSSKDDGSALIFLVARRQAMLLKYG